MTKEVDIDVMDKLDEMDKRLDIIMKNLLMLNGSNDAILHHYNYIIKDEDKHDT